MAGRARPTLRVWHRKFLSVRARDITNWTSTRSALVIAPHPDDETIGCGATIMQKRAGGARVTVVVAADGGDERRRSECREACRRLGVDADDVEFLGLPDSTLESHIDELTDGLRELAARLAPDDVLSPSGIDNHTDHRAVAGVVDALRVTAWNRADVYAYPVWYWNRWAWTDRSRSVAEQRTDLLTGPLRHTLWGRPRVVSAAGFEVRKRHALAAHTSQVVGDGDGEPLDPDWLELFLGRDELFFALQESSR